MHRRFIGLARDAWYLLVLILAAAIAFWFMLAPLVGVAVIVFGLITIAYFAFVRYDDTGHERSDFS